MSHDEDRNRKVQTGTEAAERVADVLLYLSGGDGPVGVSALARQLGLSKAVVYRILQSLSSRDLVAVDPVTREYHLGPGAVALGARALKQLDLKTIARDELVTLRDATKETTTLSILVSDMRTYIDQCESPQEIKMTVELGRLYPLYAGASSRSILAFLAQSDVNRVVDRGLTGLTEATIQDPELLKERLESIRTLGYATSQGERQSDAGSVAAPLFRGDGQVIGSISVCGPLARFDSASVSEYIPLVLGAAERISRRMGWQRD